VLKPNKSGTFNKGKFYKMSDHRQDEYLDPSEYLKHPADDSGFNRFDDNGSYYFSKLDGDKVVFMSQGYTSEAGRDNGIESVKKNMVLAERYVAEEYSGQWYISLKAGNRQEIAVSQLFSTKGAAEALIPGGGSSSTGASTGSSGVAASGGSSGGMVSSGVSAGSSTGGIGSSGTSSSGKVASTDGSSKIAPLVAGSGILVGFLGKTAIEDSSSTITKVKDTKTKYYGDDSYLPMSKYNANLANKSTIDGDFIQFAEGGKFYWGLMDSEGKMAIRSEGYASASDRDGAVAEVSKGKWQGANYSILETREGKYYVLLKDGAHNEIGRSAAFGSRAEAVAFVPETSVTYQAVGGGGAAAAGGGAMAAKAAASMAAAGKSGFVAKAGGAAAVASATAFKAAPVIAPVATASAATAGWGLVPWAAGLLLLPLLFLLVPAPTLVPLSPVIAKVVPPPPPVIPPPIPPPPAKVQLVGPKVGPKVSGF